MGTAFQKWPQKGPLSIVYHPSYKPRFICTLPWQCLPRGRNHRRATRQRRASRRRATRQLAPRQRLAPTARPDVEPCLKGGPEAAMRPATAPRPPSPPRSRAALDSSSRGGVLPDGSSCSRRLAQWLVLRRASGVVPGPAPVLGAERVALPVTVPRPATVP